MDHDNNRGQPTELERRARNLARSLEPSRDLWPGIEARLFDHPETHTRSHVGQIVATGMVAAVAAAIVVFTVMDRQAPDNAANQLTAGSLLGPAFLDARAALVSDLEGPLTRLPAKTRAIIAANLEGVQQSRDALDDALRNEPNDPLLQQLMLSASTEELQLLRELNLLASTVVERTQL